MTEPNEAVDWDRAPVAPPDALGERVPVIDLSQPGDRVVEAIGNACREWGFFQVIGHGIPPSETEAVLDVARRFFALPRDSKRALLRTRDNPWGYYDRELTKERRDRKEVFDIGPDARGVSATGAPFEGTTRWPGEPADFQQLFGGYFAAMSRLSAQLVGFVSASLTSNSNDLRVAFEPDPTSFIRINHYPVADPLADEADDDADLGVHHHTDAGALTVVLQDSVSGLQVLHAGAWHEVPPMPGAFTVNIGDLVQVWSNDRYPAALHRVAAMTDRERYSIPFFCNPSYSAEIAPLGDERPRYRPVHWGEFRRRRADGDFADYGTEVQIADYRI